MKNFYFFRHGQTNENRDGKRYSTGDNAYLTEIGVKQAKGLSKYLSDKKLDIIYSSPFNRAIETAKFVAERYKDLHIKTELYKNVLLVFGFPKQKRFKIV